MNIFYLDRNADLAAHKHCDQHVNKMILESAQLLSTAVHVLGFPNSRKIYKATHEKHPCTLWLTQRLENCRWLYNLAFHLNEERLPRFGSLEPHKSLEIARNAYLTLWDNIDSFYEHDASVALAMPDECKTDDPVQSYKNYYCLKNKHWEAEGHPMKYYGMIIEPERFLGLIGTREQVTAQ